MEWSKYQNAVFTELRDHHHDVQVVARAGSGKTTTLIESLEHLPRDVLVCCFNKRIQQEISSRTSRGTILTLHSVALRQYVRHGGGVTIDEEKTRGIMSRLLHERKYEPLTLFRDHKGRRRRNIWCAIARLTRLCSVAKNTLMTSVEDLAHVVGQDTEPDHDRELLISAVDTALCRCLEQNRVVDFDDMIWFPVMFEREIPWDTFGHVLIDEAQDINAAQIYTARRLAGNEGRVVAVGDPAQAIYRFRGASHEAFDRITRDPTRLSLPISYRCAASIVEAAREIVPDIEAAPTAPRGEVVPLEYRELQSRAAAGDFVLSRNNAPLISVCLDLMRRNIPSSIAGTEIGRQIREFIQQFNVQATWRLRRYLDEWIEEERRHAAQYPERYARALDKVACVRCLAERCGTTAEVIGRIDKIFRDDDPTNQVVCSTVHKAKGLERDRVWLLRDTFGHHRPQEYHDGVEEKNIWYVAVTRARHALYIVETPVGEIMA